MHRNYDSVNLIDIKEYKRLEKVLDNDIQTFYGEGLEDLIEQFGDLEDKFFDLENSIMEIESYIETILEEFNTEESIGQRVMPNAVIIHESIQTKDLKIKRFKVELENHKNLIEDYGEKEIKAYYYYCKKGYFKGDTNTHLFLFPKGIWHESICECLKITDIISKNDNFNHYQNIINMGHRVLVKINDSTAPFFIKKIVGSLIDTKINEFQEAYESA